MNEGMLFPRTQTAYGAARDDLLARIQASLESDPRFTAAWLAGSFGRGEEDNVSDIDLFVVVADDAAADLCARSRMASGGSLPDRLALFSAFGEPVNLHENHNNAPPGGSFSAVLYAQPPVLVDWSLAPHSLASRPPLTRLLFERSPIPVDLPAMEEPLDPEERAARLSERAAFFWMMAAVAAKYIQRGATASVARLLAQLEETTWDLAELLEREPLAPAPPVAESPNPAQKEYLRALCEQVEAFGLPAVPRAQIEAILNLV